MRGHASARFNRSVGTTLAAVLLLSWTPRAQKAEKYIPAYPRDGALVLADNARVTIWEVLREKGKRSPMYELPLDQVSVTLTEGAVKFTRPDGTTRIEQLRVGGVRFESKGTVLQDEGLNDIPSRETVSQIKIVTRDFGKPPNAPFSRRVGELLSSGQTTVPVRDVKDIPTKPESDAPSRTMMLPHEEEWVEGNIRAIWVEFKYGK